MALGLLGMAGAIGGGIGGGIARVGGSRLAGAAVGSAAGGFAGRDEVTFGEFEGQILEPYKKEQALNVSLIYQLLED